MRKYKLGRTGNILYKSLFKKSLKIMIGIACCILCTQIKVFAAESIQISKDYMMVDTPVYVENTEGYALKWYINDEFVSEGTYTPTVSDYEKWIKVEAYLDGTVVSEDKAYFSKLPVVYINTEDGEAITSRDEYKSASMKVQNNEVCDQVMYSGDIQIKGRGNASWNMPKKPYKIKLDSSTDMFGFGKNKHWVLLANYRDEALIRNTIANDISLQLGLAGADTTWVDVILNGEYVGNYQFCEQIRVDESRVNIFDWSEEAESIAKAIYKKEGMTNDDRDNIEDILSENFSWVTSGVFTYQEKEYKIADYYDYQKEITGGYLFELNAYVPALDGTREVSEFDTDDNMRVVISGPEYTITNDAMMNYVKEYWQAYEDAYMSIDGYNLQGTHYSQLADFDSMVNYWLVLELTGNKDACARSRWAYKDIDDVIKFGPVWDFDMALGTVSVGTVASEWKFSSRTDNGNLFRNWIDDPYFLIKAEESYWNIRSYMESIIEEDGLIEQYSNYLKESGIANEAIWKWHRGFWYDTNVIKKYIEERLVWLDAQFDSEESIMESLYTENSAHPYTKSDDKLIIKLSNAVEDVISKHAPADGLIMFADNLKVSVEVTDEATTKLAVYVNGLKYDTFEVKNGKCDFIIPKENFTEEKETKNVISLIGYNAEELVTYTNFSSVIVLEDETEDKGDILSYTYESTTSGDDLSFDTGNKTDGYAATSGTLSGYASLKASVDGSQDRKLEWSSETYKESGKYVPVMTAGSKNPWSEDGTKMPYFELEFSTKGYENIVFSASLGATKKGPKDWNIAYSLDGEDYTALLDGERNPIVKSLSTNKTLENLFDNISLPKEAENQEKVYIRLSATSFDTLGGTQFAGTTGGEAAINYITVGGTAINTVLVTPDVPDVTPGIPTEVVDGIPYKQTTDNGTKKLTYDAAVEHVVIRTLYGNDSSEEALVSNSFIELFNPTDKDVSLKGWALHYKSSLAGENFYSWKQMNFDADAVIKSHSSYLIVCNSLTTGESTVGFLDSADAVWDIEVCSKGGSVVLTYTDDVFPVDSKVYNNVFHKPVVSGYVDMLAVSGNDGLEEQKAPAYEGKALAEQSKKKAIRRKSSILDGRIVIADTDNSDCISGDCVIVDYSFGNQDYIAWALPASSADGESVSGMIIPQYMVTYDNRYSNQNVERFYDYGTKPEDLTMQREKYIFEGWYSDLECTEKYDFTVKPTQDVVVYAKWTKESEPTLPVTPTAIPTEKVTEAPTPTEGSRVTPTEKITEVPTPTEGSKVTPTEKVTETPIPTEEGKVTPTKKVTKAPTPTEGSRVTPTKKITEAPTPTEGNSVTPTEKITEAPTPTEGSKVTPTEKVTETPTPTMTPTSVAKSTVTPTPTAVPTIKATAAPTKVAVPSKVKTATPSPVPAKIKISKATVSKIATQYYFGKALKPTVVVKYKGKALKKGKDYTVSYKNNKKVGTAKVTMKGCGNYTGTKVVTFKIVNGYQTYKVVANTKLYKSTSTTSKQLAVLKKGKSVKAYANDTKKDKKGRVWKKVKVGSKTGYVRAIKLKKK